MIDYGREIAALRRNFAQPRFLGLRRSRRIDDRDRIRGNYSRDRIAAFFQHQDHLLAKGRVVWAAQIQANNSLFRPGGVASGGDYAASLDAFFDQNPGTLRQIAGRVFDLKETRPEDPELRVVADRITNELYRSLGEKLPDQLTEGRRVMRFSILISRRHLPHACLTHDLAPLIVSPNCPCAMILPHRYWTPGLLAAWGKNAPLSPRNDKLLHVTDAAREQIRKIFNDRNEDPKTTYIRLTVRDAARLDFSHDIGDLDKSVTIDGLTFVLDAETAAFGCCLQIDYRNSGGQSGFDIT